MIDAHIALLPGSITAPAVHDSAEQRWAAWQQRGVAQDELNRRRLLILAGFTALALASMLTGVALGGS